MGSIGSIGDAYDAPYTCVKIRTNSYQFVSEMWTHPIPGVWLVERHRWRRTTEILGPCVRRERVIYLIHRYPSTKPGAEQANPSGSAVLTAAAGAVLSAAVASAAATVRWRTMSQLLGLRVRQPSPRA